MKSAVSATHSSNVLGGVGGFAGLFDVSFLKAFDRPLLATSTDGVGTKVAIAQALDKHDTIGQDLVGMVVDDIVVVGARPLFMTDYIACGKVVPSRIADIVAGIARGCSATGTALVGGETAEHPGLLGPDDYDVAGAAVGAVEATKQLGPHLVEDGDVVLALESSGLHSNGFSLVRHILRSADLGYTDANADLGGPIGEALLEPTRLYTTPCSTCSTTSRWPGACTRSATSPVAASPRTWRGSCLWVPGRSSTGHPGRPRWSSACSATSRVRASSRVRGPGTSVSG
ncbi:hypothetical protein GCM10025867_03320 [Frondihabitans sucicola]|uniref:Phosphoribosylformylglycinamidine cyclo-ligase n=1 Tax=Frondihabitans sucicola TaxID=1268041 RepID=A0ABN6XWQ6_9MICO|nr:hypothetical protein GCM10025867_03320 [Frondihabitans sucicola]